MNDFVEVWQAERNNANCDENVGCIPIAFSIVPNYFYDVCRNHDGPDHQTADVHPQNMLVFSKMAPIV